MITQDKPKRSCIIYPALYVLHYPAHTVALFPIKENSETLYTSSQKEQKQLKWLSVISSDQVMLECTRIIGTS